MTQFLKRTWAEVNLDAIQHNFRAIAGSLTGGCRAMAIVKADAYGHGAGYVSRALRAAGADWFGVSNLDEALQIRKAGISESILILGYTPPKEAARLAAFGITQTVFNREYGEELSAAASAAGVEVRVHIKLDTGMSRIGFLCQREEKLDDAADEVAAVCRLPGLAPEGVFTHFASADEEDGEAFTRLQFSLFRHTIDALEKRGVHFALRHCCNSAATMLYPEMHMDMVRPGLILYGLLPASWLDGRLPLQPAMELKTVVSMVKTVPAGSVVSYGRGRHSGHGADRICRRLSPLLLQPGGNAGEWPARPGYRPGVHGSVYAGRLGYDGCAGGHGGDRVWPGRRGEPPGGGICRAFRHDQL